VLGFDPARGIYVLQDLFVRRYERMTARDDVRSELAYTGARPTFHGALGEYGATWPSELGVSEASVVPAEDAGG